MWKEVDEVDVEKLVANESELVYEGLEKMLVDSELRR